MSMAKILVVDDEAGIREMLADALGIAGFECLVALDGFEAVKMLREEPVDLIITDINMPNMDGLTFIRSLRELPAYQQVPILMLTTESSPEMKNKGREAGANGWLVKPFDPKRLLEVVGKCIGPGVLA